MKPLLLAASPPPFGEESDAPRWDVAELARALGGTILTPPPKGGRSLAGALEEKTASDVRQAWQAFCRRGETSVYLSLSEKAGLPLALLARSGHWGKRTRVPHVLIAHHLTSPKKRLLQTRTNYLAAFDRILVLCKTQADYLIHEAGVSPERVCLVYNQVDALWWTPGAIVDAKAPAETEDFILAVGREKRDYATLWEAARRIPSRRFVVAASSPWSRQKQQGGSVPANVMVCAALSWPELRDLYRRASVVVVPLVGGTNYAAGVSSVLEAMAMAKPLVVSQTPGIADYVKHNETCRVVPHGDAPALRAALTDLAQNPGEAARLGANARAVIDNGRDLDAYVQAVKTICKVAPLCK